MMEEEATFQCSYCSKDVNISLKKTQSGDDYCQDCFDNIYLECNQCHCIFIKIGMREHEGGAYCQSCFDYYYFLCNGCYEYHHKDQIRCAIGSDNNYCVDCFNERYSSCDMCGKNVLKDNIFRKDNGQYCHECFKDKYTNCTRCATWVEKNSIYIGINGRYCKRCYDRYYISCSACCESLYIHDAHYYNGLYYCFECDKKRKEKSNIKFKIVVK